MKLLNDNEKGLKTLFSKKIIFAILTISLLLLVGCQEKRTVSVTGEAEFEVDPDQVEIMFAVQTNATEAKDAQEENAEITQNVIQALEQIGIPKEDLETLNYNIYPITSWDEGKQTQEGFRATNSIKVTSEDLDKAGDIIDAAVGAGANRIQNIQFSLSSEKQKEQDAIAMQQAGQDAKAKAENIAQGLGLKLGKIKSVQESNVYSAPYPMRAFEDMEAGVVMEKVATTPILPNKVTVNAFISVTYSIG